MILRYGDTESLKGLDWYTVELRSEKTVESTLRRLGAQLPSIFQSEDGTATPVEVFVPVAHRDLDSFELATSNYIFARSRNFYALLRLKTVTGIVGLLTVGDSNRPSKAIPVRDAEVQGLIVEAYERFLHRADGITVGSFVRILDGPTRDWCGTVVAISEGKACVHIELKTKTLVIETPIRNLCNLGNVPEELRVFYYAPILNTLHETGKVDLVAEDLHFTEDPLYHDDGLRVQKPKKLGRQQTVTALVRRLIFSGTTKPMEIARNIIEALEKGEVRPPKNFSIVAGIIKRHLVEDHFLRTSNAVKSYADVVSLYGADYRFTIQDIADLGGQLNIPQKTTEPCTDGRSSEARQRRRNLEAAA